MVKEILKEACIHKDPVRLKRELEAYTKMDMSTWPSKKWVIQVAEAYLRTSKDYATLFNNIMSM